MSDQNREALWSTARTTPEALLLRCTFTRLRSGQDALSWRIPPQTQPINVSAQPRSVQRRRAMGQTGHRQTISKNTMQHGHPLWVASLIAISWIYVKPLWPICLCPLAWRNIQFPYTNGIFRFGHKSGGLATFTRFVVINPHPIFWRSATARKPWLKQEQCLIHSRAWIRLTFDAPTATRNV